MHLQFDIKGSTYGRRASPQELAKTRPVLKDLDFLAQVPGGIILDREIHTAFFKTLKRDCLVCYLKPPFFFIVNIIGRHVWQNKIGRIFYFVLCSK